MSTEEKRPRGRPRPGETIRRDEQIIALLTEVGPKTRNQIAELLGLSKTITYLALDRLRRRDQVRTCAGSGSSRDTLWTVAVNEPCP